MAAEQKQGSVAQEGYEWLQVLIWALVAIVLVFTGPYKGTFTWA